MPSKTKKIQKKLWMRGEGRHVFLSFLSVDDSDREGEGGGGGGVRDGAECAHFLVLERARR